VLRDEIEDEEHNTTRFVVLSRDFEQASADDGPVVTTFIFSVRNLPAALYKALGGFATNGVNMTKLESYMVGGHFIATQFLAEVDGHPDDLGVKRALEELEFFTTEVKVLGVYPADPWRGE
jgi:prephenate dehydratase